MPAYVNPATRVFSPASDPPDSKFRLRSLRKIAPRQVSEFTATRCQPNVRDRGICLSETLCP